MVLLFSKYFYIASITSYYSFYLIEKFHVSVRSAQMHLFVFLFAMALGTLFGGPIGDRIGRKRVIWVSILGVAPLTLLLPYVDLAWTGVLTFVIGLILSSAFSAILVFAQELIPGKVGAVSGLFFGFAFGIGGIGAAVLGGIADLHGIEFVYRICAYLPLLGVVAAFLPDIEHRKASIDPASPVLPSPIRPERGHPQCLCRSNGPAGAGGPHADGGRRAGRQRPTVARWLFFGGGGSPAWRPTAAGICWASGMASGAKNAVPDFARTRLLRQPDADPFRALGRQLVRHCQIRPGSGHHRAAHGRRDAHRLAAIHLLSTLAAALWVGLRCLAV